MSKRSSSSGRQSKLVNKSKTRQGLERSKSKSGGHNHKEPRAPSLSRVSLVGKCSSGKLANKTGRQVGSAAKVSVSGGGGVTRPASAASTKSGSSVCSVGIGGIGGADGVRRKPPPADAYLRFRLMPEGLGTNSMNIYEHHVFDCVVFMIVCDRHQTVALTTTEASVRPYSWLPFVTLRDMFSWSRVSRDGLAIILGEHGRDMAGEMDPTMATLPQHTVNWVSILRLQVPTTKRSYTRLVQMVNLTGLAADGATAVRCCQPTVRLRWLKLADIAARRVLTDELWGDEVVTICRAMLAPNRVFLYEFTCDDMSNFCDSATDEARLLAQIGWTEERVWELSVDYASVLYPACLMTPASLRVFLVRAELFPPATDRRQFGRLFQTFAMASDDRETVSFSQLLTGLACMHPKAANASPARLKFVFNYYDTEGRGALTERAVAELIADLGGVDGSKAAAAVKAALVTGRPFTQERLSDVIGGAATAKSSLPDGWLRVKQSYFEAKRTRLKRECKQKVPSVRSGSNSGSKRGSQSGGSGSGSGSGTKAATSTTTPTDLCIQHRPKQYEYGVHAVALDRTGRCVDPRIISETWLVPWPDHHMTAQRYSIELVFRSDSIANTFINLIRDFREKEIGQADSASRGLLVSADIDAGTVFQYVEVLCDQVTAVVRGQTKLLRLSSPLYIVGDLLGSVCDLFAYDQAILRSAPTTSTTLLALGNYSGATFPYGIECILYLFALKVSLPNKVHLLRGRAEVRFFNESSLRAELVTKYGDTWGGRMYDVVNRVFDHLPVAAIVDEVVLATHSGIPNMVRHTKLVDVFNKDQHTEALTDLERQCPLGYEMVVNIPSPYAEDDQMEEATANDFTASRNNKYYYYSRDAFGQFLHQNELSYHIRSHNPTLDAYALCYRNRCLTIFSCAKYKQTKLDSTSIVLVSDQAGGSKIRVIRFDRSTAASVSSHNSPSK